MIAHVDFLRSTDWDRITILICQESVYCYHEVIPSEVLKEIVKPQDIALFLKHLAYQCVLKGS